VIGKSLEVRQWRRAYLHRIQSLLRRQGHRIPAKYFRTTI